MDELARIQQMYLKGQQLQLQAFNDLLLLVRPPATRLNARLGEPVPKPEG